MFDLAAAGAVGFSEWSVLHAAAGGCTCEIETAQDATNSPGYDSLNRAWLATVLLILRGYGSAIGMACSSYSWDSIAGAAGRGKNSGIGQNYGSAMTVDERHDSLPPFNGGLLDFHLTYLSDMEPAPHPVRSSDAAWIAERFDTCDKLAATNDAFRLALEAVADWRFARDERTGIARIWVGIEALLAVSSELVYRISIVGASLLEPRGEARRVRYRMIKKLYNARSKAVHGDRIPDDVLVRSVVESRDLLHALLLYSIELGRVPTDEDIELAVLG